MRNLFYAFAAFAAVLLFGFAFAAPVVDLSASPTSGAAPLNVTLTWSSTGAASCIASDGWTGSKPTSGTQGVTVNATTTYTLICSAPEGSANLSWTPPTQNTDGSPLTDLVGYELYYASSSGAVPAAMPIDIPLGSAFTINLPPGTWYFGLKAENAQGETSAMSNIASKVVATESDGDSVTVTITPPPSGGFVTTSTQVMELRLNSNGNWLVRAVGTIPLGEACIGTSPLLVAPGDDWFRVPKTTPPVNFTIQITHPKSVPVARCAAQ